MFKHAPAKSAIWITIFLAHLSFIGAMFLSKQESLKPLKKPLVVKTLSQKPSAQVAIQAHQKPASEKKATAPKKSQEKKTLPIAAAKQKSPKDKEPPIADKKIDSKKKSFNKTAQKEQNRSKISQKLLQELEESIAKIDEKQEKIKTKKKLDTPTSVLSLQIDRLEDTKRGEETSAETEYQHALIHFLEQTLRLPDYGEVKMQLTLTVDGKVASLKVLLAESEKNKKYLEKNLPLMQFPSLMHSFSGDKERTFVLTFCNKI
jgi:hypothetical protein